MRMARGDGSLATAARQGDEQALRELVDRFRPMIVGMATDRFLPGAQVEDLHQEGMIGLWHAIRDHDPQLGPFGPFARLCVDRQMWTAISRANRLRHRPLQQATSFEDWMDVPDDRLDPAVLNTAADTVVRLRRHIGAALSDLEQEALARYTRGDSYDEIAAAMSMHRKRIDNALQRARRKIQAFTAQDLATTG